MLTEDAIREKFRTLRPELNERALRLSAAAEAKAIGRGGVARVARATGLARSTILRGVRELGAPEHLEPGRVRRAGGGRKRVTDLDPALPARIERLVEPTTKGDPQSPLLWTSKSLRLLATELARSGHPVSHRVVGNVLRGMGYSLKANRKTLEGASHPDRNAQFELINRRVSQQLARGEPAISVDAKKKELVGEFKNAGREWRPKGRPERVRVHDFIDDAVGKAIPYGIYDVGHNAGWVSVGIDHDTAEFAVSSIRAWWRGMGRRAYPRARSLLIVADSGGSNGYRLRLWKWELRKLANELRMPISVSHLPPGTSKWNKIEHRLFSFISKNWRGKPLVTYAVIVGLIAGTRTRPGLKVRCRLDRRRYPTKRSVSDEDFARIRIERDRFHGEWNYTILPDRL